MECQVWRRCIFNRHQHALLQGLRNFCNRRCHALQHTSTQKHKAGMERRKLKSTQLLKNALTSTSKCNQFFKYLCNALLAADIPLWKLQHRSFQAFLEKYTKHSVPEELMLKKGCITECYKDNASNCYMVTSSWETCRQIMQGLQFC